MKNILWLASYPKSGNTWFRLFLANYLGEAGPLHHLDRLAGSGIASSARDFEEEIGLDPFELLEGEVDSLRPAFYRCLSGKSDEVLFKKVHDAYRKDSHGNEIFPEDVSAGVLYFVRNPLDVFVSYCNHVGARIQQSLPAFLQAGARVNGRMAGQLSQTIGTWQEHVFSWVHQKQIPVKVIRYEDMKQAPLTTFAAALRFCNIPVDDEKLKSAIANCQFEKLQNIEASNGFKEKLVTEQKFFWKGIVGNFHNYLTEEQIDRIIDASYEAMFALQYIDRNRKLTLDTNYEYYAV